MTSKLDEELERLSKAATQGVWRYRPDQYDDWGIVKSAVATDGFACVLAQFRDPDALDNETLARHREAKTDPWEANARFVTTLVNAYRTGQLVPTMPSGDVVKAVKDAARYRWLRDHSVPPHNFYISVPDEFHGVKYGPDEVDAYIDAARAALGEKP